MALKITASIKQKLDNYKNKQARKKAQEEARRQKILSGEFAPVSVSVILEPNEKAYLELSARRMAVVDKVIEKTVGKTKKKGVVTRAVVGGVLLGPLGALGGAATAGSKGVSNTTQEITSKLETIDSGNLILTNKRLVFVGKSVLSLAYNKLVAISFTNSLIGQRLVIKYEGMLNGEQYVISGDKAKDAELYYRAIIGKRQLTEPK